MTSRRDFLNTVAGGLGAAALRPSLAAGAPAAKASAHDTPEVRTSLGGPVGLQLYSLREQLKKDVPGTLARARALGIREVESAGLWGQTAAEHRAALDKADLRCRSSHMPFDRLRDEPAAVFKEAKALGATAVVCPWIPHEKAFTRDDAQKAAEVFNRVAKAGVEAGLAFAYHCHGYEFAPSDEGTLFDTLAGSTDPVKVGFEVDVFWASAGGADPAALITKYKGRVPFLHIKEMRKGLSFPPGTSGAPGDTNVAVGQGQLDWPGILRAAKSAGTSIYYIEDESPDPFGQIPQSLKYLAGLKV